MDNSELDNSEITLEDLIRERTPNLLHSGQDAQYTDIGVGRGWWPIVTNLCDLIAQHIANTPGVDVKITQIKEKFGGLRFYYDGGDQQVQKYVDYAEMWAKRTCEQCGEPGVIRNDLSWLKTLCVEHYNQRKQAQEARMAPKPVTWIEP